MSIKISFLHYMKWTRVMLPVVFEEFEVVCILLAVFSFHYNCQLVRDQQKAHPVSTGLLYHLLARLR